MKTQTKFFLGANSNIDFVSYFRQLQEPNSSMQLLILKGGPGSGKSSLMKRILNHAENLGHSTEIIPCASDPDSLDAVIDYTADFSIMDGTAPHTEDPLLPGARHHIIYTGDLWDCDKLSKKSKEIYLTNEKVSDYHKSAGAYIKSASALLEENIRYTEKFINRDSAAKIIKDITEKVLSGKKGTEKKRLLSAVTVGGISLFSDTPFLLSDKTYILNDEYGAAADFILKAIAAAARAEGEDFIYCPCSVLPMRCDHLIFPESRISILKENSFLKFKKGKHIKENIFYKKLPDRKSLDSRLETAGSLLSLASESVNQAKAAHDDLEKIYINAMDFRKMDDVFNNLINRFYS